MFISKIIDFNKEDKEAEVCVSDGEYSIIGYIYPAQNIYEGQKINAILSFGCDSIVKEHTNSFFIKKMNDYYAYCFKAQVISKINNIVGIGEIQITLDANLPGDVFEKDFISCYVMRLDVEVE